MPHASAIIDKFGGTRPMATALGLKPSTVQYWKTSGFIPARHQQKVLERAQQLNIPLTAQDFFVETAALPPGAAA